MRGDGRLGPRHAHAYNQRQTYKPFHGLVLSSFSLFDNRIEKKGRAGGETIPGPVKNPIREALSLLNAHGVTDAAAADKTDKQLDQPFQQRILTKIQRTKTKG